MKWVLFEMGYHVSKLQASPGFFDDIYSRLNIPMYISLSDSQSTDSR